MAQFRATMIGDPHIEAAGGYDGKELTVPPADLAVMLGDWVQAGTDEEYEAALSWIRGLGMPYILIRGNHDNGAWHRAARQVCPPAVTAQLVAHSPAENMQVVEWKPMIWEPVSHVVQYFPRKTEWHQIPAEVQPYIIKRRDVTPAYYTYEAGDLLFVCLDASDWLLGNDQMRWIEATVAAASGPVVILTHHHFLPVSTRVDGAQVHERDFLRNLVLRNPKITACLHGHAHQDRWWKYGDTDIVAVRQRTCRTVTFEDGRITGSILDGEPDSPRPFVPEYLWGQCPRPGSVAYLTDTQFDNPRDARGTDCLGWLPPRGETIELVWSMRLDRDVSEAPHRLVIQARSQGELSFSVSSPGLGEPAERTVPASPDGRQVALDLGPLDAGHTEARLRCSAGWGYAALAARVEPIEPTGRP